MTWNWELGRIAIDATSFFCVTIDLYGEKNLEDLTVRLNRFFRYIKLDSVFRYIRDVIGRLIIRHWLPLLGVSTAGVPPEQPRREQWWEPLVGGLMIAVLILPLGRWSLVSILPIIIILGMYAAPAFGLFLLKRVNAKGVLLTIGASQFVVLKLWDVEAVLNGMPHHG